MDINEARKGFRHYFNLDFNEFNDFFNYFFFKRAGVNIIKLDEYFHNHGYSEEKHGSLKDYVKNKYGDKALDFLKKLL